MVVNRKSTNKAMTLTGGSALGALFALIWTFATSAVLAKLIDGETLKEEAIGYGSMVILLTGSMLGSLLAYHKVKHQRVVVCALAGGMYFLMLLAITALFFGGQYNGMGVTALVIMAGSGTSILLGMGHGRRKVPGVYKNRH